MRLRSPLRPIAPKAAQWRSWRLANAGLVSARCRGRCEGCGGVAKLDVHHVAGREEEPFSSLAELTAGLCRDCHRAVTGELGNGINWGLRGKLASDALTRLNDRYNLRADSLKMALARLKKLYTFDEKNTRLVRKDT